VITADLQELGSKPIRPDAPSGAPGRDEREFEVLQLEIRKLELPDQPTVNWDAAVDACAKLLGEKSKDLLVAAYLCVALFERDGVPGLAAGLTVMRDLLANFWETLYPELKRMRGRMAALEWLAERGAQAITRRSKGRAPADAIAQCIERIGEIDERAGTLMDSPPLLGDLRRALEELAAQSAAPAPQAARAAEDTSGGTAAVGPPTIQSVESAEDLEGAYSEAERLLDLISAYLYRAEPSNPLTYRLPRLMRWRTVVELPPNEDGQTMVPDPDPELWGRLEQLLRDADYAAVMEQTEGIFPNAFLWLDLNRFAALALEGQGESFAPAAEGVALELGTLLRRLPRLLELKTQGGQPLASDATRRWIAKRVLTGASDAGPSLDAPASTGAGARPRGGEGFAEAVQEAKKLARQKKLADALTLLEKGAHRAERLDDRVAWKLEVARLCMGAAHHEMALAQLEALDEELRGSSIEDWDPQLCVEVIKNLLLCRQKAAAAMDAPPTELAQSRDLMGRLCRLDVLTALELDGKK
jgi:type VI secretion system protein VasJ